MKKKHHYVAQSYLRLFSTNSKGIYRYDCDTGVTHGCSIRDVGQIRDYYSIDHESISDRDFIEKKFSILESDFARLTEHVSSFGIDSEDVRTALIRYVLCSHARVPKYIDFIDTTYRMSRDASRILSDKYGCKYPFPEGGSMSFDPNTGKTDKRGLLHQMNRMMNSKEAIQILSSMKTTVYRCPFGTRLVTSDAPVVLYHPDKTKGLSGVGFATPGVEVTFPLTKYLLVKFEHGTRLCTESKADSGMVLEFNRRTMAGAERYIFCGDHHESIFEMAPIARRDFCGRRYNISSRDNESIISFIHIPVGPSGAFEYSI